MREMNRDVSGERWIKIKEMNRNERKVRERNSDEK